MLNMVNLRDMDVTEAASLYLLHFIYVFMVSVLLLNFLIAIFSDSVNIVNENHDVIHDIQRLSIICTTEERVSWICRRLYWYFHRRYFIHRNGKVFITVHQWLE